MERRTEHFRELLNVQPSDIALQNMTGEFNQLEIDLSCSTKDEVNQAVGKLKNIKVAGHDKITDETLKAGGRGNLINWLLQICIAV